MPTSSRATRDSHFRRILEGLEGQLDHQLFEEAVQDLLRGDYPGLVPVHGGSDAGFDAAVADSTGEAYPVMITTRQDSERKFKEDLEKLSKQARRKVVAVTSRDIAPQTRAKLFAAARERGFTLLQIHDRRDLANRLYRDSGWTHRLLGITGATPALSARPVSRRPIVELAPVGREADLEWLQSTPGDLVLEGVPGSGKTFLMVQLARHGEGLFLATDDWSQVADAVRELRPDAIFVDDSHFHPETLDRLRHLRNETRASFRIIASTWPGDVDVVATALGSPPSNHRRTLKPLTRAEILEILRSLGVDLADDEPMLHALVDMSANKPGLAVLLGSLFLRGELEGLISGTSVAEVQLSSIRRLLGASDPEPILAAFALGGDGGMDFDAMRKHLELSPAEAKSRVSRIAAGGVLDEVEGSPNTLRVQPAVFRFPLISRVFFETPALDWKDLVHAAPDLGAVTETLVEAALRGARVPDEELKSLLLETESAQSWGLFAMLGAEQAAWVIERFPGSLDRVASATLERQPRTTIIQLLELAEAQANRNLLAPVRRWMRAIPESSDDVTQRRREVVEAAVAFISASGSRRLGLETMMQALSPRLEQSAEDPTGRKIVMRLGVLPHTTVDCFIDLWGAIPWEPEDFIGEVWAALERSLDAWVHPDALGREIGDRARREMLRLPRRVLRDLASSARERPGLASALARIADAVGAPRPVAIDSAFSVLYPIDRPGEDFQEAWERQNKDAAQLAREWATRAPGAVAAELAEHEREARSYGHAAPGKFPEVTRELALRVVEPVEWCHEFLARESAWAIPFLRRSAEERHPGWQELILRGLDLDAMRSAVAAIVFGLKRPPKGLLEAALEEVKPHDLQSTGRMPLGTLRRLLGHEDDAVAAAAAVAEWLSGSSGKVREAVREDWLKAFARAPAREDREEFSSAHESFWMRQILLTDSEAAWAWLQPRLEAPPRFVRRRSVFKDAASGLTEARRQQLIELLPAGALADALLPLVIGESAQRFESLLQREELRSSHLEPLAGRPPDAGWMRLAERALAAGHSAENLARASLAFTGGYSGSGVEHWSRWREAFERLSHERDDRLREIAEVGLQLVAARIEEAEARQRHFELTGEF